MSKIERKGERDREELRRVVEKETAWKRWKDIVAERYFCYRVNLCVSDLLNFFSSCILAYTTMRIPLNGVNLKSRVITVLYLETKTEKI